MGSSRDPQKVLRTAAGTNPHDEWATPDGATTPDTRATTLTARKARNLMARPRAALLVPGPASPYRTLEIRGDVEITPDDDYRFARHVGHKYGGTDFRYVDKPGESPVGSSCTRSASMSPISGRRRAPSGRPPRSWSAAAEEAEAPVGGEAHTPRRTGLDSSNGARLISRATRPGEAVNIVACAARLVAAPVLPCQPPRPPGVDHEPPTKPATNRRLRTHWISGAGGCLDPLVGQKAPTGGRLALCGSPR